MALNNMSDILAALQSAVAEIEPTDLPALAKAHSRFCELAHYGKCSDNRAIEQSALACVKRLERLLLEEIPATQHELGLLADTLLSMRAVLGGSTLQEAQFPSYVERDVDGLKASADDLVSLAKRYGPQVEALEVHLLALETDATDPNALRKSKTCLVGLCAHAKALGLDDWITVIDALREIVHRAEHGDLDLEGPALEATFDAAALLKNLCGLAREGVSDPTRLENYAEVSAALDAVLKGEITGAGSSGGVASGKRLGDALVDEGVLTHEDLEEALSTQSEESQAHRKLGDFFVEQGIITADQLDQAIELQRQDPNLGRLGDLLVQMGAVTQEEVDEVLGEQSEGSRSRLGEVLVRGKKAPAKSVGKVVRSQGIMRSLMQFGIDAVKAVGSDSTSDDRDKAIHSLAEDPEVLARFAERCSSQLRAAEFQLLGLQSADTSSAAALNTIIRIFHNIKRVSGCVGLDKLEDYARAAERLFRKVRSRDIDLEGPALDAGLEVVAGINAHIQSLLDNEDADHALVDAGITRINDLLAGRRAHTDRMDLGAVGTGGKRLGELLVSSGVVSENDIESLLQAQAGSAEQRRLGDVLTSQGLITNEQLEEAIAVQSANPDRGRLGDILVQIGAIDTESLSAALLSQQKGSRPRLGELLVREGKASSQDVARVVRTQNFVRDLVAFGINPPDAEKGNAEAPEKELVTDFVQRAQAHLDAADVNLLRLEEDHGNSIALDSVRRAMIGIKRIAGYVGLDAIHAYTFEFEKLLDAIREGDVQLDGRVVDFAFDAVEVLSRHIAQIELHLKTGERGRSDSGLAAYRQRIKDLTAGNVTVLRGDALAPSAYTPKRLGDLLIDSGAITKDQLAEALSLQSEEPETKRLGQLLLDEVRISEAQLQQALDVQAKDPSIKLGDVLISMGVIDASELAALLDQQARGDRSRLGEIIVRRGYASAKTVARAVRDQRLITNLIRTGATAAVVGVAIATPYAAAAEADNYAGGSVVISVSSGADAGIDTDGDGLLDSVEKSLGTDINEIDSDKDGIDDAWEVVNGLDPLNIADAAEDIDGDRLDNLNEFLAGSSPFDADTDLDGFFDGLEVERGSDATASDSVPERSEATDLNADGTTNAADIQLVINAALGEQTEAPGDVDNVGGVNALDIQLVIASALN